VAVRRLTQDSETETAAERSLHPHDDAQAVNVRPKFVALNLIALCLCVAAWRAGFFAFFDTFTAREVAMLVALTLYSFLGFVAAFLGRWNIAAHVANGLPIFALAMTGIGMLLATLGLDALTPQALAHVFRDMVLAISPNILGVLLMAWLRELMFWCGDATV
jgi:hypothetical protein